MLVAFKKMNMGRGSNELSDFKRERFIGYIDCSKSQREISNLNIPLSIVNRVIVQLKIKVQHPTWSSKTLK